jgi:hypothetical protein
MTSPACGWRDAGDDGQDHGAKIAAMIASGQAKEGDRFITPARSP